ncbi:hypothetical protein CEY00_Acc11078 [Actinidia chinensis var. chinensis]|uniref:C2 domain-containing protein n=1 Tax=Actinidia chinensis var. chinensis TaxID=1590841 RepID=A0A2R6R349_ACTCC|nr:hypothetical protein CEY00_Acc11078 [Actinidia chinensis var. chinensis]
MEYRPLDITVISAENLKDVNLISKMDVYVEVSIGGDPVGKRKTHVDKDGGKSPKWNHRLKFAVGVDVLAANPALPILFKIRSDRPLGDKDIGDVSVPIKELLDAAAADGERVVEYKVRTPSGKSKGTLKFSYKFGDKLAAPAEAQPPKSKNAGGEAVMAYPAHPGPSAAYPPSAHVGYAQPYAAGYAQPQPGYGYPPPQPGYGGYPPQPGYGYPAPAPGYGYPPVQAAVQHPKKKKNNFGLGLAGGLLGGLLVGDMISDAGEMAAYDDGFDAGFDF